MAVFDEHFTVLTDESKLIRINIVVVVVDDVQLALFVGDESGEVVPKRQIGFAVHNHAILTIAILETTVKGGNQGIILFNHVGNNAGAGVTDFGSRFFFAGDGAEKQLGGIKLGKVDQNIFTDRIGVYRTDLD